MKENLLPHIKFLKEVLSTLDMTSEISLTKTEISRIIISYAKITDNYFYESLSPAITSAEIYSILNSSSPESQIASLVKKKI